MDKVLVDMAMLREHVKIRLQPLIRSSTYKKEATMESPTYTEWEENVV